MRRSGISSAHRRATSLHSSRRHSSHHRHGISNSHAFAVGRATGVNINGSGMGAHGAALHRSAKRRQNQARRHRLTTLHRHSSNASNLGHNINYESSKEITTTVNTIVKTFVIIYLLIFLIIIGTIIFLISRFH